MLIYSALAEFILWYLCFAIYIAEDLPQPSKSRPHVAPCMLLTLLSLYQKIQQQRFHVTSINRLIIIVALRSGWLWGLHLHCLFGRSFDSRIFLRPPSSFWSRGSYLFYCWFWWLYRFFYYCFWSRWFFNCFFCFFCNLWFFLRGKSF